MTDLCWLSLRVPIGIVEGTMEIGPLLAMRRSRAAPPPFTAMLAKAFGLVAAELPELRRMYSPLPWPRLFEAEVSSASIIIERDLEGEPAALPVMITDPAGQPLTHIAAAILEARAADIQGLWPLGLIVSITRLPRLLRRLLWLMAFHSGRLRGDFFGTFAISTLGQHGLLITRHVTPVTTVFALGPLDAAGRARLCIGFDHRAYDGAVAIKLLKRLEAALNGPIREELAQYAPADGGQPPPP